MKLNVIETKSHSFLVHLHNQFDFFQLEQRQKSFTTYGHKFNEYQLGPIQLGPIVKINYISSIMQDISPKIPPSRQLLARSNFD